MSFAKQGAGQPAVTIGRYAVAEQEGVSPAAWNRRVEGSPGGGHIFQSYEWAEFKRRSGWRPVRLALERDGEPAGVGQFLLYPTLPVPGRLMYCPKGPWLAWEDEEAVRAFFGGVVEVARRYGAHTIKIEPEVLERQEREKKLLLELGFEKFRWDLNFKTTIVVDLDRPEEDILAGMKRTPRYNVRLAGRKGVEVVEDNSAEGRAQFWRMFDQTAGRHGFEIRRPREYLLASWQALYDAGRAHLFFAEHEGDRLAAMFVRTFGRKYWYAMGASTDEKRNLKPTYVLQWEVMRWAKSQGFTFYDMVSIPNLDQLDDESHPMHGVYKFKAGFGGEISDFIGCYDLPVKPARAKLWNRLEPTYYRLYQRLKGDIYY